MGFESTDFIIYLLLLFLLIPLNLLEQLISLLFLVCKGLVDLLHSTQQSIHKDAKVFDLILKDLVVRVILSLGKVVW